ncbi:hypothetical protein JBE04_05650 [Streptomyces sp. PRKS01-29]|nr:hypothetical protein [Streptomyces sabulosicollis]MBI0293986.1 hypothetical protein [Streptomyces sabulosicollis]
MPIHVIKILFRLGVLVFLAGGLCIVVGQALGLVLGDAAWVSDVATTAGPPTFIAAGITGLLAYILTYARPGDPEPATAATPETQQPATTASQPE